MYLVRCSLLYHPAVAAAAAAAVVDATDAEMLIIIIIMRGLPARGVTSRKSRGCVDYIRQRRILRVSKFRRIH